MLPLPTEKGPPARSLFCWGNLSAGVLSAPCPASGRSCAGYPFLPCLSAPAASNLRPILRIDALTTGRCFSLLFLHLPHSTHALMLHCFLCLRRGAMPAKATTGSNDSVSNAFITICMKAMYIQYLSEWMALSRYVLWCLSRVVLLCPGSGVLYIIMFCQGSCFAVTGLSAATFTRLAPNRLHSQQPTYDQPHFGKEKATFDAAVIHPLPTLSHFRHFPPLPL